MNEVRSRRVPGDDLNGEHGFRRYFGAVQLRDQEVDRGLRHRGPGGVDGGEPPQELEGLARVVEAGDGEIIRHADAAGAAYFEELVGTRIVPADDRRRPPVAGSGFPF